MCMIGVEQWKIKESERKSTAQSDRRRRGLKLHIHDIVDYASSGKHRLSPASGARLLRRRRRRRQERCGRKQLYGNSKRRESFQLLFFWGLCLESLPWTPTFIEGSPSPIQKIICIRIILFPFPNIWRISCKILLLLHFVEELFILVPSLFIFLCEIGKLLVYFIYLLFFHLKFI